MASIGRSIRYPTSSDHWLRNIALGGILTFLSFLFIPVVFVYGYVVLVIRSASMGSQKPPQWGSWMRLFIDGVQVWVIGVLYLLIPTIVGAITVGGAYLTLATGGEIGAVVSAGTMVIGGFITVLLFLLFGYIGAAGIVNFSRHRSFLAAFDTAVITPVISDRAFGTAFLFSILILVGIAVVGSVPVIGWIIVPFVGFYGLLVIGHLLADGFATALERAPMTAEIVPPVYPADSTD